MWIHDRVRPITDHKSQIFSCIFGSINMPSSLKRCGLFYFTIADHHTASVLRSHNVWLTDSKQKYFLVLIQKWLKLILYYCEASIPSCFHCKMDKIGDRFSDRILINKGTHIYFGTLTRRNQSSKSIKSPIQQTKTGLRFFKGT